jgi:hypothetical protein
MQAHWQGGDEEIVHINDIKPADARAVLQRALEPYLESLEEAVGAATTDGTIDDPQDLADVAGDMNKDMEVGNKILEALRDRRR